MSKPRQTHLAFVNEKLIPFFFSMLVSLCLLGQTNQPVLPITEGYSIQLASAEDPALLEECAQELRGKPFLSGYCGELYLKKDGDLYGARLRIVDERTGSRINVLDVQTIRDAMLDNVRNQTRYKRAIGTREDARLLVANYTTLSCGGEQTTARPAVTALPSSYDNRAASASSRAPLSGTYSIQLAALDAPPDRSDFPVFADKTLYYPSRGNAYRVRLGFFNSQKAAEDFIGQNKALQKYRGAYAVREDAGAEITPVTPASLVVTTRGGVPQAYEASSRMVTARYGIQLASLKEPPQPGNFARLSDQHVYYRLENGLYKVHVGFYDDRSEADYILQNYVKPRGFPKAYVVEETAGTRMTPLFQPTDEVGPEAYFESEEQAYLYTVKKGDTLFGIAQRQNLSVDALCRLNGITERARIRPGQRLRVR